MQLRFGDDSSSTEIKAGNGWGQKAAEGLAREARR